METSRRTLIKGIGAAICAGMTPSFVRAALPPEVLGTSLAEEMEAKSRAMSRQISQYYGGATQQGVKEAITHANWQNANRHPCWDDLDIEGNYIPGHEDLGTSRADKGLRPHSSRFALNLDTLVIAKVTAKEHQLIKS